jgi:hypothetical protein
MFSKRLDNAEKKLSTPNLIALENLVSLLTQVPVKFINPIWMSTFRLHHRGVNRYYQNRAFLAGDAAHIHSPIGGQGMNTGIQDSTNLAWKLALVLKKNTHVKLLDTYETERHAVGRILLKITDRFFSLLTAPGFLVSKLRNKLLPWLIKFLFSKKNIEKRVFWFISQLNIHYAKNQFNYEIIDKSNLSFKGGVCPGHRAPNAPVNASDLFTLLAEKPFNILYFKVSKQPKDKFIEKVSSLTKNYKEWLKVHVLALSSTNRLLFERYGITSSAIYVIRPDGYVGFRINSANYTLLADYLKTYFK